MSTGREKRFFIYGTGVGCIGAGAAALLCVVLIGAAYESSGPAPVQLIPVRVTKFIDGDTVRVDYGGRSESVRLLRINTPERKAPGYYEANRALSQMLEAVGWQVQLEFEWGREERDRYGRLLCYLHGGGRNLNLEMVRMGWSHFYIDYGHGRYAAQFEKAEADARAANRGLWPMKKTLEEIFKDMPLGR